MTIGIIVTWIGLEEVALYLRLAGSDFVIKIWFRLGISPIVISHRTIETYFGDIFLCVWINCGPACNEHFEILICI